MAAVLHARQSAPSVLSRSFMWVAVGFVKIITAGYAMTRLRTGQSQVSLDDHPLHSNPGGRVSWTFSAVAGTLTGPDGTAYPAYSGNGLGFNNPEMEPVHDVGPIPAGMWAIGAPHTDPEKGPIVMALTPMRQTQTYGRSGFLIHGDNPQMNHSASEGCIVAAHDIRQAIASSGDTTLVVS